MTMEESPKDRASVLADELLQTPHRALAAATEVSAIVGPGGPESQENAKDLLEVPGALSSLYL